VTEQSQSGGPPPRTASAILSAAETLAEEIRERAHADADAIRAHAGSESDAARSAIRQRVRRLSEIADEMHARLGEMRAELDELSGSLAGDGDPEIEPAGAAVPQPAGAAVPQPAGAAVPQPAGAAVPEPAGVAAPPVADAGVDDAGARLIALNLALSDTPRDEAARQLRDQVPDPERLVDEVYASVDR
jgi:hypothetical protein